MILTYEELIDEAEKMGLIVKEKPLKASSGRIKYNKIAIRKDIPTSAEKKCILAEEIGHYIKTAGNILDQSLLNNRKQERQARIWAYTTQIEIWSLIKAWEHGCMNSHEIAEFLDVTEEFLADTINYYRCKYGISTSIEQYIIYFEPNLTIKAAD